MRGITALQRNSVTSIGTRTNEYPMVKRKCHAMDFFAGLASPFRPQSSALRNRLFAGTGFAPGSQSAGLPALASFLYSQYPSSSFPSTRTPRNLFR